MSSYVLSAASNLTPRQLTPFLRSLAKNVPHAAVVLFVRRVELSMEKELKAINPSVTLVPLADHWMRPLLWLPPKKMRASVMSRIVGSVARTGMFSVSSDFGYAGMHVVVSRFKGIADYLQQLQSKTGPGSPVMICDARDVIVQADPFPRVSEVITCGVEDIRNADRDLTRQWLSDLYDEGVLQQLAHEPVICAGVMIGRVGAALSLLKAMLSEIETRYDRCLYKVGPDQAALNKMVYVDGYPVCRAQNGDEYIATVGSMNSAAARAGLRYKLDPARGVTTASGVPICVVHQYDRKQDYADWVAETYGTAKHRRRP